MNDTAIKQELQKEAEKALVSFRDGSLLFLDHEFGLEIPHRVDFEEWVSCLEDYLDVNATELEGENRFLTIKRFFPKVDDIRLRKLINNPQSITEDECLEWRRSMYEEDSSDADFLIMVPLELSSGETGSAIIRSYSNIPGGEFVLVDVFSSVEEGQNFLKHYSL